jgi:Protein of unknown function (DUF2815)
MPEAKKDDNSIILKNVRLSYAHLWKPRENDDGKKSFSVSLIVPKDHPQVEAIKTKIRAKVVEKWPDPKKRPNGLHNPLRDGDTDRENDEAYKGAFFINASAQENRPPKLIDAQLQEVPDNGHWGSGDFANVKIDLFPFERKEKKGIGVGLVTVQFTKHGERLGGTRTDAMEGFGVEEGGDAEDMFA